MIAWICLALAGALTIAAAVLMFVPHTPAGHGVWVSTTGPGNCDPTGSPILGMPLCGT